jgi:hypothetical protein
MRSRVVRHPGRIYARTVRLVLVSALLATASLAACSSGGTPGAAGPPSAGAGRGASSPAAAPAGAGCGTDFTPRRLPVWARTGFTPPTQRVPYVLGDGGDIVAILWADHDPLSAPPRADRNNKILWASPYGGTLRIEATRSGSDQTVVRTVPGGPGPSIIDLPAPGCWSLDLTWGGHHDHLRLGYAPA